MLKTENALCLLCGDTAESVPVATGWDFEYATTSAEYRIHQCVRCETVFLKDRPAAVEMACIYPDNYYTADDSEGGSRVTAFVRNLIESSKVKRYRMLLGKGPKDVIDIGCGDGRLLDILTRNTSGWRFSGIEISFSASVAALLKGYQVEYGNFEEDDLPWRDASFDLALLHQVIEHTRDPREVLRRAARILVRGGLLSIETPDVQSLDFRLFKGRYWGGYHIPRHFYLFNKRSLTTLLEQEGFEVVRIASILSPVFWIHSVHNWLVDKEWGRGVARFFHYRNPLLLAAATAIDLIQTTLFHWSSNMQVIARKR
jgi:SAM-dependent methyltransferase